MSRRERVPGTYGPWPVFGPLSRSVAPHVGRGRPQGRPAPRLSDNRRRVGAVEQAARLAALSRPKTRAPEPARRSFLQRMFRRGPR